MKPLILLLLLLVLALPADACDRGSDCCERTAFWTLYRIVDEANFGPEPMEARAVIVRERVLILELSPRGDVEIQRDEKAADWRRENGRGE